MRKQMPAPTPPAREALPDSCARAITDATFFAIVENVLPWSQSWKLSQTLQYRPQELAWAK